MSLQHGRCTIATPRTRCGMHVWRWVTWNPVCVAFFWCFPGFPSHSLCKQPSVRRGVTPSTATTNLDRKLGNPERLKQIIIYNILERGFYGILSFWGVPGFIHALALPPRLCQVVKPLSASQFITMVGVSNLRVWQLVVRWLSLLALVLKTLHMGHQNA